LACDTSVAVITSFYPTFCRQTVWSSSHFSLGQMKPQNFSARCTQTITMINEWSG